jgi:hypothetical protein
MNSGAVQVPGASSYLDDFYVGADRPDNIPSPTPTVTSTPTPSITSTPFPTDTFTNTPTPTNTEPPTQTPTDTSTSTPTMTPTEAPPNLPPIGSLKVEPTFGHAPLLVNIQTLILDDVGIEKFAYGFEIAGVLDATRIISPAETQIPDITSHLYESVTCPPKTSPGIMRESLDWNKGERRS